MSKLKSVKEVKTKALDAMARLDALEAEIKKTSEGVSKMSRDVDDAFRRANEMLAQLNEQNNALIGLAGVDGVKAAIEANRIQSLNKMVEENKVKIAELVQSGKLVKVDTISEKSLLVGHEETPDGKVLPPGYLAVNFAQISSEDFRKELLGKNTGFCLSTPEKGGFIIEAIYDLAE